MPLAQGAKIGVKRQQSERSEGGERCGACLRGLGTRAAPLSPLVGVGVSAGSSACSYSYFSSTCGDL